MFARDEEEDSSDSDEEEEEEEVLSEEEEEEEPSNKGQPPAKKRRTSTFFDEEAEASDDDEEEEEEDDEEDDHDPHDRVKKHYTEEDIRREQMDEEARELIRQQDRRRAQSGGNRFGDTSVADMAREIEDRHRMSRRTVHISAGGGGDDDGYAENANFTQVSQQSLVPSVSDPSLWMVSCSTGKEEELVFQIMNKSVAYARQGRPLGITSAIAAQSKGKIYIESYSEPAVKETIENIRGLMQYSMRLVPIQDMTTVMTVTQKKKPGESKMIFMRWNAEYCSTVRLLTIILASQHHSQKRRMGTHDTRSLQGRFGFSQNGARLRSQVRRSSRSAFGLDLIRLASRRGENSPSNGSPSTKVLQCPRTHCSWQEQYCSSTISWNGSLLRLLRRKLFRRWISPQGSDGGIHD